MAKKESVKNEEVSEDIVRDETTENQTTPENNGGEMEEITVVSGADFHNFEEEPYFEGFYLKPVVREQDSADGDHKKGDLMGYLFADADTGEEVIIGNSHQIEKTLRTPYKGTEIKDLEDCIICIRYLGKGVNSKKQPFNKFKTTIKVPKN